MVFQVLTKHQMLFRQFYNPLFDIGIQIQTIAPLGPIDVVHRDTYVYYVKQYLISYLNESRVSKALFIKKVLFLWSHIHHGTSTKNDKYFYNERIPYIIQVGICFFFVGPFSKWIAFLRDDNGPFYQFHQDFCTIQPPTYQKDFDNRAMNNTTKGTAFKI